MLTTTTPRALLGQYAGIFLKPLRNNQKSHLKQAAQGILLLEGFEATQVDLLGAYDKGITPNRTWWFRFNQLPTLGWASGIWTESNHARDFIGFNFDVVNNWVAHSSEQLPLKWHDHASAFRMKNMADWYVTIANYSTKHDKDLEVLAEIIDEHLQWLCEERNYSRLTNHGFEQARLMMSVASEMPGLPTSTQALRLALLRLQDEICFAFTGQGVHKENSPGYQWFMIKVMQEAKLMLDGYGLSLHDIDFRDLLSMAKSFLDAIALPDNSLPLIGDTQYKEKQNAYVFKLRRNSPKSEGVQVFDYSKSGYVIVKDFTDQEAPIHLVFKNGHLSDYHRHNDDLSIHLTKGNTVIFGDGGLYSHNQADIGRQYAKSAWAHSTTFPVRNAQDRVKHKSLIKYPEMRLFDNARIVGQTWLYYPCAVLTREVLWGADDGLKTLSLLDAVQEEEAVRGQLVSCFLLPVNEACVSIDKGLGIVSFRLGDVKAEIQYSVEKVDPWVQVGDWGTAESTNTTPIVSKKIGDSIPATRLEFYWKKSIGKVPFKVRLLS